MIPKHAVALALADTMLARDASLNALMDSAIWAFGKAWPWVPDLCTAIHARTGDHFHHFSRDELADIIAANSAFRAAWSDGNAPQILRYSVDLPRRPAPPAWLAALALPALPALGDLAQWLGLSVSELDWFADRWRLPALPPTSLQHYHYRWVAKRSGGWRLIEIPKPRMRCMQQKILRELLDRVPLHAAAHGFRQGHSCVTHAALHSGKRVLIRMDLKNFFPSIPAARVQALFAKLGYSASVAGALARLCVNRTPAAVFREHDIDQGMAKGKDKGAMLNGTSAMAWAERQVFRTPHLPQGSPCSPALANLCAYRLDLRLESLAASVGALYSRYADDLAFSGGRELERAADRFHAQVAAIAIEEGFGVNTRKTRIMRAGTRQQLTGIVVNRHPNVLRSEFDTLKAILNNCVRQGPASQNHAQHPQFRQFLEGKVAWVSALNPARGAKLQGMLDAIAWPPGAR